MKATILYHSEIASDVPDQSLVDMAQAALGNDIEFNVVKMLPSRFSDHIDALGVECFTRDEIIAANQNGSVAFIDAWHGEL